MLSGANPTVDSHFQIFQMVDFFKQNDKIMDIQSLVTWIFLLYCSSIAKSNFSNDGGASIYFHVIVATIRLSYFVDFFTKIPLVKGGFMRIELTYISTQHTINCAAAGPSMTIDGRGTTIRSGRTCPYIISSPRCIL